MGWTTPGAVAHVHCRGYLGLYPHNDVAIGFLITEDVAQRILSNYCYLICLKVMVELPGRNKDSVQQLLDLRIPSLRLV